jgi:hypothetical protein
MIYFIQRKFATLRASWWGFGLSSYPRKRMRKAPSAYRYIVFLFSTERFSLHFGDQLFFEPSVRALNQTFKGKVFVVSGNFAAYFAACGYSTAHTFDELKKRLQFAESEVVIITRDDMLLGDLKQYDFMNVSFYGTPYPHKICNHLHSTIAAEFSIGAAVIPAAPLLPQIAPCEKITEVAEIAKQYKEVYHFNPFAKSIKSTQQKALAELAQCLESDMLKKISSASRSALLIVTGSKQEAAVDFSFSESFKTKVRIVDLRGAIAPEQMLALYSCVNISHNYSMDTYPYHLATIKGVKSKIFFRYQNALAYGQKVRQCFVPSFADGGDNTEVININYKD